MPTTATGLTTNRWTLALDGTGAQSQDMTDWLGLHTEPSMVAVPQSVSCSDGNLSLLLSIPQGEGRDPLQVTASMPLVSDPPVSVVCWHRWVADYMVRTCIECGQQQVMDWVDVG